MNENLDPKYQAGEPPLAPKLEADVIISFDTHREERIPPGQSRTRKWPVLHAGQVPDVSADTWSLRVDGLVANPFTLDWNGFCDLPRVRVFADFHCVTRWSRLGNLWEGVSVRTIMDRAQVSPEAKFVVAGGFDNGWTTNLPLADFCGPDVLLADTHDGEPIDADHGGPVRLMVPLLFAWKSAKWVNELRFVAEDAPGYWESIGYHDHGDPWVQNEMHPEGERFRGGVSLE